MTDSPVRPLRIATLVAIATLPCCCFGQATGTEFVSFWAGDFRILAADDQTSVTLIDIDTGLPLNMADARILTKNFADQSIHPRRERVLRGHQPDQHEHQPAAAPAGAVE